MVSTTGLYWITINIFYDDEKANWSNIYIGKIEVLIDFG